MTGPTSGSVPGTGASAAGASASLGLSRSAARSWKPGMRRHAIMGTYVLYPNRCSCQMRLNFLAGNVDCRAACSRLDSPPPGRGHGRPARRDFDRLTKLAVRVVGATSGLISLLDDEARAERSLRRSAARRRLRQPRARRGRRRAPPLGTNDTILELGIRGLAGDPAVDDDGRGARRALRHGRQAADLDGRRDRVADRDRGRRRDEAGAAQRRRTGARSRRGARSRARLLARLHRRRGPRRRHPRMERRRRGHVRLDPRGGDRTPARRPDRSRGLATAVTRKDLPAQSEPARAGSWDSG